MRGETHPVVVKYPTTDLGKNVASGRLECGVNIGAALRARFDEEQALFLCPSLPFLCQYLSPFTRQIVLVSHEDARQVRVCMCTHIRKPSTRVVEACSDGVTSISAGYRVGWR
jgi:hypothetical protein